MELTMFILFILVLCISQTVSNHRRKVRRARCARLSHEAVVARGAQILSIRDYAANRGHELYEPRRACR
ncbi:MAG: hypothetical protein IKU55_05515 [Clostridia bacterium]|nr:hypothetical protein [Clostridia bacterium]